MSVSLIATLVLSGLAALAGVLVFVRKGSWAALVRGLGLTAVVVGLFFVGVMDLLVLGTQYVIEWIRITAWTQQMTNASITIGVGLLAALLAGRLPKQRAGVPTDETAKPAATQVLAGGAVPTAAPVKKGGLDAEEAEIEAMLKARGIE